MIRSARKAGFTLVEILIVVVILGILAAVVIPQFSSASESARASSFKSQLQTIRSQIELFQVQHNGNYPAAMADGGSGQLPTWQPMTDDHDYTAATNAFDFDGTDLGPYLQKFPVNPFAGGINTAATHWEYNATTGAIRGNLNGITGMDLDKAGELGLDDAIDFVLPSS